MLDLYLIAYRNYQITYDCLESLIETASEPIRISVCLNNDDLPNSGTEKIRQYLREQVDNGRIRRSLEYTNNNIGWSFVRMMRDFPPEEPIMFFSDCDMVNIHKLNWISISKKYHEEGKSLTGFNLDTSNYAPYNTGFSKGDCNFGVWLMCGKTEVFMPYFKNIDFNSIDGSLMTIARYTGGGYKIEDADMLHATWGICDPNSPYYDKEYCELKQAQASNWVFKERPADLSYRLIEKGVNKLVD